LPPARDDAIPRGEVGEICVRGPNVFRGYVSNGNRGLVVRDGWLHTGDLGRCNPDGTVVFLGLLKPMFTRSGFNVYPREIERVVRAMPGVDAVEVRAVAEPSREHDIHLRVDGDVTEKAVRHWCEERLATYKRPSHLVVRRRP
jgi:acyl-CoA synthetase (AMP-forming)/AMP-acid ligase II